MAITKIKTTSSFTNLTKYDSFLAGNAAYNPSSYESIASATGTGSSNTITFSSIAGTYQHLQIRAMTRTTNTSTSVGRLDIRFNGDSASNYTVHNLTGDGATAAAEGFSSQTELEIRSMGSAGGSMLSNTMAVHIIDIQDYASTTRNKTMRAFSGIDDNNTNGMTRVGLHSGVWMSTSAITSIELRNPSGGSWATTTQFALYGIKGA
jgi:hypothetical protein